MVAVAGSHDGITDFEGGDLAADGLDDAGNIGAQDNGVLFVRFHDLVQVDQVDGVEADGAVADADLIGTGLGVVGGDDLKGAAFAGGYALADGFGMAGVGG